MYSRAIRRHHFKRLRKKRIKTDKPIDKTDRLLGIFTNTPKPCKCSHCRNPRHSKVYRGEHNVLTVQERRHLEYAKKEIEDALQMNWTDPDNQRDAFGDAPNYDERDMDAGEYFRDYDLHNK